MPTINQLKSFTTAAIRNKTANHSVTRGDVSDQLDRLADEDLVRGVIHVSSTALLPLESHENTLKVLVENYGLFIALQSALAPDNVDTFYSANPGWLWRRVLQNPTFQPDDDSEVRDGGFVTWVAGYTYDITRTVYNIAGAPYDTDIGGQVTLAASDPTLDRIDIIAVDNTESFVVITGTPAENPQAPSHNPATQLPLSFVFVAANTTEPVIPQQWIYQENIEWVTLASHATINPASPNNPFDGFTTIEATNALPSHQIRLTAPAPPNMSLYNVLSFKIRSKATWSVLGSGLNIQFYDGATPVGVSVLLQHNSYVFNSSNNSSHQTITIPLSALGLPQSVTNIIFRVQGTAGTQLGFYLDDIQLQQIDDNVTTGRFFEDGGNGWGKTAVFGTKDNNDISIILNNVERGKIKTTDVFEYRGNVFLTGADKGISLFSGTFAASDYYVKRTGTSTIVHAAGIVDLQIGQRSGYTVNSNIARGHEWYDMKTPTNAVLMQLLPSGALSLKKYVGATFDGAAVKSLGVDALGNVITFSGGVASGTVTSFSAGNLSPLFTTNVANASTTPALTFTLVNQNANLVYASPASGAAAVPSFRQLVNNDIIPALIVNNGLSLNGGAIQLGGTNSQFTSNRTITTSAFSLTIPSSNATQTLLVSNSDSGIAVKGSSVYQTAIWGESTENAGVIGQSNTISTIHNFAGVFGYSTGNAPGIAGQASGATAAVRGYHLGTASVAHFSTQTSSANVISKSILINQVHSGVLADVGNGTMIEMCAASNNGVSSFTYTATALVAVATDVGNTVRDSNFIIKGRQSGTTATLSMLTLNNKTGKAWLNMYGDGTFAGTPVYGLGVLADGQLVEYTISGGGGGTVASVTGTANRISVDNTDPANPIVDIHTSYTGQTSIITLGTITTGSWQATTITPDKGGTGQTTYTNGQLLIGNSTGNTLTKSTLTQGTGIAITNGTGSITIASAFNHTVLTSSSATYSWVVANGENLKWTITGTSNELSISAPVAGRYYTAAIIQGDGNDTVSSWPAGTIWFGGIEPVLSTGAGDIDFVVWYYDGTSLYAQFNPLAGTVIPLIGGGTGSALTNPGVDRIMFWDNSSTTVTWLEVGSGLTITGTVLSATGGGGGGADTALSNLASVAINTTLVSDTNNTDDLGTSSIAWKDAYLYSVKLKGATSGTTTLVPTAIAGTTTLTLPAVTSTVAVYSDKLNVFAATTSAELAGVLSDETGSGGGFVRATSPTLTSPTLAAGTSGAGGAPLYFTSGTLLSTPVSGAVNFDGNAFYATTASGRGIWPSVMFVRLTSDATLSNVNTEQAAFGSSADVWTLQPSTTYYFEGEYILTHGAVSHSLSMSFVVGGGGTIGSISYSTICWVTAIGTNTASQTTNVIQSAAATLVNAAGANANETVKFSGHISLSSGGTPTITPSITFSAAPNAPVLMKAGSYIRFTAVGSDSVQSVGNVA